MPPGGRSPIHERELIRRAQAGDAAAFDALVAQFGALVLRVARSIVGETDAEDVAQEVFLRLYRALASVDPERPLEPFLVRIAVNAARTERGRRGRRREDVLEAARDRAGGAGPGAAVHADDVRRALLAASATLTERERLVFRLRDLEGLEAPVVAEALGIAAVTVRRLSGNARSKVIAWLRIHRPELVDGTGPDRP
ncbi:MAG: sigma-70 family RNA polymerase sigma factor [Acidobacteriota bacterium]